MICFVSFSCSKKSDLGCSIEVDDEFEAFARKWSKVDTSRNQILNDFSQFVLEASKDVELEVMSLQFN
jgi:hypothetical protein